MSNPVTLDDLERRWRPLSDAEQIVAQAFLDDALAIVYYRIPDLEARLVTAPTLVPLLRRVIANAVRRAMLNPDGVRQTTDSFGSRSISTTRDSSLSGNLVLTADDLAELYPIVSLDGGYTVSLFGEGVA